MQKFFNRVLQNMRGNSISRLYSVSSSHKVILTAHQLSAKRIPQYLLLSQRQYSAGSSVLKKEEIESRIIKILQGFDKVSDPSKACRIFRKFCNANYRFQRLQILQMISASTA